MPLMEIEKNLEHWVKTIFTATSFQELEKLKVDLIGKSGVITSAFKMLKNIDGNEKKLFGEKINKIKAEIENAISNQRKKLEDYIISEKLKTETLDITLPVENEKFGGLHIITQSVKRIRNHYLARGFLVLDGPEVETDFFNFDALNIPKHHPARDMQDTFYTDTGHLLRTHTTSVQARVLEAGELPVKIISCGRVYRNETEDSSHQAMFHQYDLVWIDKGITLSHLMAVLNHILKSLYGKRRKVRFVSKFYPYTCPSIGGQIDCALCASKGCSACKGSGWVTIVGAGMVHENVLREFKYDPKEVGGMAFGLGTSRLAAQFYQAPNLKTLYDSDLRYLKAVS